MGKNKKTKIDLLNDEYNAYGDSARIDKNNRNYYLNKRKEIRAEINKAKEEALNDTTSVVYNTDRPKTSLEKAGDAMRLMTSSFDTSEQSSKEVAENMGEVAVEYGKEKQQKAIKDVNYLKNALQIAALPVGMQHLFLNKYGVLNTTLNGANLIYDYDDSNYGQMVLGTLGLISPLLKFKRTIKTDKGDFTKQYDFEKPAEAISLSGDVKGTADIFKMGGDKPDNTIIKNGKPNITGKGKLRSIGDGLYEFIGPSHDNGGINVGKTLEVEGGEVGYKTPTSLRILSNKLDIGGITPAQAVKQGADKDEMFVIQEAIKDYLRLNDDGTRKAENGKEKTIGPTFDRHKKVWYNANGDKLNSNIGYENKSGTIITIYHNNGEVERIPKKTYLENYDVKFRTKNGKIAKSNIKTSFTKRQKLNNSPTANSSSNLEASMHHSIYTNNYDKNEKFAIPYGDREIIINGKKYSVNHLDSILLNAGRAQAPYSHGLGLYSQETDGGRAILYNYKTINKNDNEDIKKEKKYYNRSLGNTNYSKNYGITFANNLIRNFTASDYNIPKEVSPLFQGIDYFERGLYNTGDLSHTTDVLRKGNEFVNDDNFKKYYNEEGKYYYNKGLDEKDYAKYMFNLLPNDYINYIYNSKKAKQRNVTYNKQAMGGETRTHTSTGTRTLSRPTSLRRRADLGIEKTRKVYHRNPNTGELIQMSGIRDEAFAPLTTDNLVKIAENTYAEPVEIVNTVAPGQFDINRIGEQYNVNNYVDKKNTDNQELRFAAPPDDIDWLHYKFFTPYGDFPSINPIFTANNLQTPIGPEIIVTADKTRNPVEVTPKATTKSSNRTTRTKTKPVINRLKSDLSVDLATPNTNLINIDDYTRPNYNDVDDEDLSGVDNVFNIATRDRNKPLRRQGRVRVTANDDGTFTNTDENGNIVREHNITTKPGLLNRIGSFINAELPNIINTTSDVVGSILSYNTNRKMIDNMIEPSAPIPYQARKLKTNYNVNNLIDTDREHFAAGVRETVNNSNSSAVSQNRINRLRNASLLNRNNIYNTKENTETQLINADITNQQEIANKNVDVYNTYLDKVIAHKNNVNNLRSENRVNFINNLNSVTQSAVKRHLDRKKDIADRVITLAGYPHSKLRMEEIIKQIKDLIQ